MEVLNFVSDEGEERVFKLPLRWHMTPGRYKSTFSGTAGVPMAHKFQLVLEDARRDAQNGDLVYTYSAEEGWDIAFTINETQRVLALDDHLAYLRANPEVALRWNEHYQMWMIETSDEC